MSKVEEPKITLNFGNLDIDAVVRKVLFESLDDKIKTKLAQDAIEYLTNTRYGDNSELKKAYNDAVGKVCHDLVDEQVKNSQEFKDKISKIIEAAMKGFLEKCTDDIIDKIGVNVAQTVQKMYKQEGDY